MAGESPDKSEQRKSSGETAPGERDPRLAVFRQASPGAAAPGVDQPTAVFKMPPPEAEAAAEPPTAREPGTESGSVEGDARLRAAVATWVATADGEDDAEPESEPEAEVETGEATDCALDEAGPVVEEPSATTPGDAAGDVSREEPGGEADSADDSDDTSDDSDDTSSGDPVAAEAPDRGEPAVEEPSVDAAAPEAATADVSEPVAEIEAASADVPDDERDDGPSTAEAAGPAEAAAKKASSGTSASAGSAALPDLPGEQGDAAGAARAAGEVSSDDASASAPGGGEPAVEESADALVVPEAPTADGSAPVADVTPPEDSADADADADAAPDGDRVDDAEPVAHPAPTDRVGSEDAGEAGPAVAPHVAPWSAKANDMVDQPTTMFKALRPPAVDQPTTALKLPPTAPPRQSPKPESDVERTSTFVPLRPDGVRTPTPRKPEVPAPVEAAAVGSLGEAERTRQQPMPPLPPLDLLAELTNTPPPVQTPVRTVVRRFKIWTPFAVLLLIVFAVVQTVRPLPEPTLTVSGEPTFTFEGGKLSLPWPGEGQGAAEVEGVGSLGTYGAQKPAPIASVAKTMTAYVILKEHPITGDEVGPKITVDRQAGEEAKLQDESRVPIKEGEEYTEKQMLQMLMIPSGNNAARLLARWDAKSEAEFVKKMNDAAKDLGMTNSTYTDPSGLKATTVSTPKDQLKLAKAVMQNDVFREIVNTPQARIPGLEAPLNNNNDRALLLDGVGGIKTGSSTPAGGNLLWAANALVDGKVRRMVGITMGVQDADSLNNKLKLSIDLSIKVIQAAQQAVISDIVVKKGDVVGYVDDGLGGRTAVVATKELKAVGWAGLEVEVEIGDGGKALPHSAKAGDVVGQVSVGSGTGKVSAPVALQKDLVEPGFGAKLTRLG